MSRKPDIAVRHRSGEKPIRGCAAYCTLGGGGTDHVEVGEMNDTETTGIELLLSDPRFVAWLEPDEDDEPEDDESEASA
jgi:hypothetical protein